MNRFTIIGVFLFMGVVARADEPLAEQLRNLDLKNVSVPNAMRAWSEDLRVRQQAVNKADRKAWLAIQTREDWETFKKPRIEALRASLGEFPEPLKNPRIAVTKTIQGDGFQIANMIYETRPGFFVTANLYAPAKPAAKMPGILIITSHHNPKSQGELQDMGMTWARQGCLVLIPDQIGHGERRNHPFIDAASYPGSFKVGRQDYYFRYNEALQLHLIGDSLMGWMVWDTMRGVDLLLSKEGIDKNAIILLGSVAGGGDPAAVTAALDPRISAVVPFNFGGPQPETKYPLPADAETSFNYMGSGSWESTRNLRLSGKDGFLPWVIVGSIAPRGLIYSHEFAWDKERDPVWARLQKIYSFYEADDKLSSVHGRGSVTGQPPEATHCNNIGPEHRLQIYPTLKKWFGIAAPEKEYQKRVPAEDLLCWTEEAKKMYKPRALWEVAGDIGKERAENEVRIIPGQQMGERFFRLFGHVTPASKSNYVVSHLFKPMVIEVGLRRDSFGSYFLFPPGNAKKAKKYPVVVGFAQAGIRTMVKERADTIAALLENGIGVCLLEMRGMGIKGDRGRTSTSTSISATELMLAGTVLGHQLRELRELIAHLRKHETVDSKRLALWGDSLARVNPPDRLLEVPLDADRMPELAEPGSCLLAMAGGLFEQDVRAIYGRGGLVSNESVLHSPFVYVPHDAIMPIAFGDWSTVAAALYPRYLRLEGMVDGLNRRVSNEELEKTFVLARTGFQGIVHTERVVLSIEPSSPETLARWFAAALKN